MIENLEAQIAHGLTHLKKTKGQMPREIWVKEFEFLQAARVVLFQRNKALLALKELGAKTAVAKIKEYETKVEMETQVEVGIDH